MYAAHDKNSPHCRDTAPCQQASVQSATAAGLHIQAYWQHPVSSELQPYSACCVARAGLQAAFNPPTPRHQI